MNAGACGLQRPALTELSLQQKRSGPRLFSGERVPVWTEFAGPAAGDVEFPLGIVCCRKSFSHKILDTVRKWDYSAERSLEIKEYESLYNGTYTIWHNFDC
jgi:hypothetical protein